MLLQLPTASFQQIESISSCLKSLCRLHWSVSLLSIKAAQNLFRPAVGTHHRSTGLPDYAMRFFRMSQQKIDSINMIIYRMFLSKNQTPVAFSFLLSLLHAYRLPGWNNQTYPQKETISLKCYTCQNEKWRCDRRKELSLSLRPPKFSEDRNNRQCCLWNEISHQFDCHPLWIDEYQKVVSTLGCVSWCYIPLLYRSDQRIVIGAIPRFTVGLASLWKDFYPSLQDNPN